MTPPEPTDGWRSLIPPPGEARTPLALGVELRRRARADAQQWAPRPLRTATARDLVKDPGELFLGVRPLIRNAADDAWIQGDASWDAVRRRGSRFDAAQSRWFADLLSICRDSLLSGTAGDWLLLDPVSSGVLWSHLARARAERIPLVATERSTSLRWRDDLVVRASVERDEGGALLLAAEGEADGETFPAGTVHPVGEEGAYAHRVVGARIELVLGPVAVPPVLGALLNAAEPLVVPPGEQEAFFREAYPLLRRGTDLRAGRGVTLPAPPVPRPLLVLDHRRDDDAVAFRFWWDYAGYGRVGLDEPVSGRDMRDPEREALEVAELVEAWTAVTPPPFAAEGVRRGADAAEFVTDVVPALETRGVTIEHVGPRRPYARLTGEPEITVSTVESTDPDWFDLGVLVRIDGRSIPFQPLFRALSLRHGKLKLVDGSWFSLRHPAFDRLKELLDEAAELAEWETGPRIARTHLALWEDFEDLAHEALPARTWRAAVAELRATESADPPPVPSGIRAELRPYQRHGYARLALLWRHRLGGVLADDMGLGKTLQILALIAHAREAPVEPGDESDPPFLVVAPTSVVAVWAREAERYAPGLRIAAADRTRARRSVPLSELRRGADVVLTSYAVLRIDADEFTTEGRAPLPWSGVVLDEAQHVKNPGTRVHQAAAALSARAVYAVTGTPIENGLAELWAILSLTSPGLFPSARRFREEYIQPIEQGKVPENAEGAPYRQARIERLRHRVRPFVIRRTKELVAADLPERQEQVLRIELAPAHRARYDAVLQRERQKVLGLLPDLDRNRFIVFRSLTLLRMLSLAPGLIDPEDAAIASRKLETLVERLLELRAEGHRALVFSQFTSFLGLAQTRLRRAGLRVAYLDGATRDRDRVVQGFREGDHDVFLLSLKAGGVGLTLVEADYVFLLDPWWNPAAESQAIDRAHRIGQDRPVFAYRMIAADTIEEKVLALQQRKSRLFAAVMDDEDLFAGALTAEDIRGLLED